MTEIKAKAVGRFYFLEYFFILLKSVETYKFESKVFDSFRDLKQIYQLGESKYRRLTRDAAEPTSVQMNQYRQTFKYVIQESEEYGLVKRSNEELRLTRVGTSLLEVYETEGFEMFKMKLFTCMESRFGTFGDLVRFCYEANPKGGPLIFPNYSPLKLGYAKSEMTSASAVVEYSRKLVKKLEEDIEAYLERREVLSYANEDLLQQLRKLGLLEREGSISAEGYNPILKRFRDHWYRFFLQRLYGCNLSVTTFEILIYRAKQVGILNASAFFPNFSGKIVYPTSVVIRNVGSQDFQELFKYANGESLFMHTPSWEHEATQEDFVRFLTSAYSELKRGTRSYFVNLASVRELVCFKMKISEVLFDSFLEKAYRLNLQGELPVSISLEVDRLPHETKAMYLVQSPVLVEGKYRNIIAIDFTREKNNGQTAH